MILGLSGYARAGKDTAADILVSNHGYRRIGFADPVREMLSKLDPIVGNTGSEILIPNQAEYERATPLNTKMWLDFPALNCNIRLSDVIRRVGWDNYKDTQYGFEIREQLQRLGTDAGRNLLGENIWVHAALSDVDYNDNIVITDCRFPNEAQAIKDAYGTMWRVERPGIRPVNSHASETALDDWHFDYVLNNDSTPKNLADRIERALTFIK